MSHNLTIEEITDFLKDLNGSHKIKLDEAQLANLSRKLHASPNVAGLGVDATKEAFANALDASVRGGASIEDAVAHYANTGHFHGVPLDATEQKVATLKTKYAGELERAYPKVRELTAKHHAVSKLTDPSNKTLADVEGVVKDLRREASDLAGDVRREMKGGGVASAETIQAAKEAKIAAEEADKHFAALSKKLTKRSSEKEVENALKGLSREETRLSRELEIAKREAKTTLTHLSEDIGHALEDVKKAGGRVTASLPHDANIGALEAGFGDVGNAAGSSTAKSASSAASAAAKEGNAVTRFLFKEGKVAFKNIKPVQAAVAAAGTYAAYKVLQSALGGGQQKSAG